MTTLKDVKVSKKLLMFVVLPIAIGLTALTWYWERSFWNALSTTVQEQNTDRAAIFAGQMGAAVKFKQYASVNKIFVDAFENKGLSTFAVWNPDGKVITSGASETKAPYDLAGFFANESTTVSDGDHVVAVTPILFGPKKALVGVLGTAWSISESRERLSATRNTGILVSVAVAVVTLAILLTLAQVQIVGRLSRLNAIVQRLAEGDRQVDPSALVAGDEIGELAGTLDVFRQNMREAEQLRHEREHTEKRAEAEKRQMMDKMASDFEANVGVVVEGVSQSTQDMQESAQVMASTAEQANRQSNIVAAAAEQASSNVQTVAAAAEELTSSIREIGHQVTQSTDIASRAVTNAKETNQEIQGLAEAASKIGDVVSLITDIAGQTNLLALNATIEAARAGDAGKGFAVVASEVKNLASQTGRATDEIGAQVDNIQDATKGAVVAIEGIVAIISEINEITSTIAAAVEEQGAATQEIARNIEQAASGTTEVSANISSVTQASNDTGNAAAKIVLASGELSQRSESLSTQVEQFLAQVRAT
ncbi:MAG: HAMP domain-containing protein [Rhodospirillales bacterium]|nr:HAMP domain-containing protein [Rhodospirillales bacterium]